MKQIHQFRVAGVGTAIGAVMFGGLWLACAPGKLPCDKDEWKEVCALPDDPNQSRGGSSGGGGGGGSGGSGAADTGGVPAGMASATTPIPGCTKYPTLGSMDEFFATRCGSDGACHTSPGAVVWKDLKMPGVWDRMRTVKSTVDCANGDMIDTADWQKSVLWTATRTPKGTCANGGTIIRSMPPQEPANVAPKLPPLDADESACLEGFLKALKK